MEQTAEMPCYCVFRGWFPGIYGSMNEVQQQVNGHDSPNWMRYPTVASAMDAWAEFCGDGNAELGRARITVGEAPSGFISQLRADMQRTALQALQEAFDSQCSIAQGESDDDDIVPPPPPTPPLIRPSMQH
ncbi:hypothetical protein PIB30_015677 [Stylosanthes scabra]|uniref:Ribonuclease H1 N-terminal domain-containing protein n=1 Tax=Stylosanthes scabra TaxID=79078 RepID=A0ABU6U8N7_9FABA|nr:hypothetical protein [Stylosanthes scabra]